jgi:hypothetical protein
MGSSSESPADASWSQGERETYEEECLRETRAQLERVLTSSKLETQTLRDLRLEGGYPDTRVIVTFWDERYSKESRRAYWLWKNRTFVSPSGIREPPDSVGMFITTWSLGG